MPKTINIESKSKPFATHQGVAAVDRALSLLGAFTPERTAMSLAQLAVATGLYKSTILRLIISLEAAGYIRRVESGDYQLGPALFELGHVYQLGFRLDDHVVPALSALMEETEESASFYIREGESRLCLFRVDCRHAVRDHVQAGDKLPLDRGAGGRILMAFEQGAGAIRGKREMVISTVGERQSDTAAVAAPVFAVGGRLVGALSVSGPKNRFTPQAAAKIAKAVLRRAESLSNALGGDPAWFAVG